MLMLSVSVNATEVTLSYTLPIIDCENNPLSPSDLGSVEIYMSDSPIPSIGESCSNPAEPAPVGFTPVIVPAGETTVVVDLAPGVYYFRARVSTTGGLWSNLSEQTIHTVDNIQAMPPTVFIIG